MDTLYHIDTVDGNASLKNLNDFYSLITCKTEEDLKELLNNMCDTHDCCKREYIKNLYNNIDTTGTTGTTDTTDNTTDTADDTNTTDTTSNTTSNTTNYMKYVFNTVSICSMLFNSICLAKLTFLN